ncbi:MAG: glycosyltransferase family 2 protein [Paludibacteraceae bacterium]|nr:glycosyltransferase family 2 protein [Paludibacteraceae bacterium]
MFLSICFISHNQRQQLKRCLDSLLAQKIHFEYEILVSDDASEDGSFELAQEYEQQYSVIHAYRCNTSDFNPTIKSSRSGWNRCNAVQHATGKYLAFVDGDDFFLPGKKVYELQVELLEKNEHCSCCMANCFTLQDGATCDSAELRHIDMFETGEVISAAWYLQNTFRESHCFVYRRRVDVNLKKQIGGYLVDNTITAFHLQYGDIVCLNDAGYVYVQYKSSVWNDYKKNNDYLIVGCPALFNTGLFPDLKPIYWQGYMHICLLLGLADAARKHLPMSEAVIEWTKCFGYYTPQTFLKPLTATDKIHFFVLYALLKAMKSMKRHYPQMPMPWRLLDKLL